MMNKILLCTLIFILFGCDQTPINNAQNYIPNKPPVITDFKSDLESLYSLEPNLIVNLEAIAFDPNDDKLTCEFTSPLGYFSNQTQDDKGCRISYVVPENYNNDMEIIITVKVKDAKGAASTRELNLGTGKRGPTLTVIKEPATYIRNDGNTSLSFSADSNGKYHVYILAGPIENVQYNQDLPASNYSVGTEALVTIYGPGVNGANLNLNPNKNTPDIVAIVFIDSLMQQSKISFLISADGTSPSGYFSINNGDAFTKSHTVSLQLYIDETGSGLAQMMVANDASFTGASWQGFSSNLEWQLPSGDGLKTVWLKVKDVAGNETIYNKSITLDNSQPIITNFSVTTPVKTANRNITIELEATDAIGITGWLINESGDINDGAWSTAIPGDYGLISPSGLITLYAWARDGAGNVSEVMQQNIELVEKGTEDLADWNKEINMNEIFPFFPAKLFSTIDVNNNIYILAECQNVVAEGSWQDWCIKKYNPNGNEENVNGLTRSYCKTSGNPNPCTTNGNDYAIDLGSGENIDIPGSLATDSAGNIYIVGLTGVGMALTHIIKKFSVDGSAEWSIDLGVAGFLEHSKTSKIVISDQDEIYVVIMAYDMVRSGSSNDILIKKFNPSGNELKFNGLEFSCNGHNPCSPNGLDLAVDSNGGDDMPYDISFRNNFLYVGGAGSNLKASNSDSDLWIMKFNVTGVMLWQKNADNNLASDRIYSFVADSHDNLYIAAVSSANDEIWLKKYNNTGDEVDFSPPGLGTCLADGSISPCTRNGLDLVYAFQYNQMGSSVSSFAININYRDEIFISGIKENITTHYDIWLMKFNTNGVRDDVSGNKIINNADNNDDILNSLLVDSHGNVFIVGSIETGPKSIIKKFYY